MTGPVLALVTATPLVAAVLIMLLGRTRPLGVRVIAVVAADADARALALHLCRPTTWRPAGFQFRELYPLVRALGISVELGIDGMSVLMVLLTAIIIFAGVFASWTVRVRDQEFYALLLTLVTGVFGVFVSLDLFVFFLFYEIAVLPMYLLIGIWGSTGRGPPAGALRLGVPRDGRRHQGIRGDEADPLSPAGVGVHPGRALRPLLRRRASTRSRCSRSRR